MKKFLISLAFILGTCTVSFAEERQTITLEDAISIAKKEVPGEVVKAEFDDGIYEIKIITEDGERIKVKIDPYDGSIIRKGKILKGPSQGSGRP